MISLKNFEVSHPLIHCFTIDHLDLDYGQVYYLVGENGSGKSSFLKKLGFSEPHYAYISFPDFGLLNFTTLRENLTFFTKRLSLSSADSNWIKQELQKKELNLDHLVSSISQGQAQFFKFLLIIKFPHKLICLDELFNYVDGHSLDVINKILLEECLGKIIIVSATQSTQNFSRVLKIENKKLTQNFSSESTRC